MTIHRARVTRRDVACESDLEVFPLDERGLNPETALIQSLRNDMFLEVSFSEAIFDIRC